LGTLNFRNHQLSGQTADEPSVGKDRPLDTSQIIENAISTLANTMRIYVEAQMRFGGLFKIDREEAIDNVDHAFEMKLEASDTLWGRRGGPSPDIWGDPWRRECQTYLS
jgi:hypothetical protein